MKKPVNIVGGPSLINSLVTILRYESLPALIQAFINTGVQSLDNHSEEEVQSLKKALLPENIKDFKTPDYYLNAQVKYLVEKALKVASSIESLTPYEKILNITKIQDLVTGYWHYVGLFGAKTLNGVNSLVIKTQASGLNSLDIFELVEVDEFFTQYLSAYLDNIEYEVMGIHDVLKGAIKEK